MTISNRKSVLWAILVLALLALNASLDATAGEGGAYQEPSPAVKFGQP